MCFSTCILKTNTAKEILSPWFYFVICVASGKLTVFWEREVHGRPKIHALIHKVKCKQFYSLKCWYFLQSWLVMLAGARKKRVDLLSRRLRERGRSETGCLTPSFPPFYTNSFHVSRWGGSAGKAACCVTLEAWCPPTDTHAKLKGENHHLHKAALWPLHCCDTVPPIPKYYHNK